VKSLSCCRIFARLHCWNGVPNHKLLRYKSH